MSKPPTRYERPLPPPVWDQPSGTTFYPAFYLLENDTPRHRHTYGTKREAIAEAIAHLNRLSPGQYTRVSVFQKASPRGYDRRVWYGVRDDLSTSQTGS